MARKLRVAKRSKSEKEDIKRRFQEYSSGLKKHGFGPTYQIFIQHYNNNYELYKNIDEMNELINEVWEKVNKEKKYENRIIKMAEAADPGYDMCGKPYELALPSDDY